MLLVSTSLIPPILGLELISTELTYAFGTSAVLLDFIGISCFFINCLVTLKYGGPNLV